jgi:hypothetical protein
VPGCRGNYDDKEKISVFTFPIDPTKRNLWLSKIPRADFQPTTQSAVCARHFSEQFIVRSDSVTRPDGSVLTVERTRPKLSDDAYPSVFPNCPSYLSEEPPTKRRKPEERRAEAVHRDECAFNAYLECDQITNFSQFSKEFKDRTTGTGENTWMYRLQAEQSTTGSSDVTPAYWSMYKIHDAGSNTTPTLVAAIRIFADLHVEVFSDRDNTGIGK